MIKNATIRSTMIGLEDHGIPTCLLNLDYGDNGAQSFGGRNLRGGKGYGMWTICRILDVLGVDTWENLPGTHLRVDADDDKVHSIGHIIDDDWFKPEEEQPNANSGTD